MLYALRSNINLFFTPSTLERDKISPQQILRLGGMVEPGSVHRFANSLQIEFNLTDFKQHLTIKYEGMLPNLFKEGNGVIAEGSLAKNGIFYARRILAKHDEKYTRK